MLGSGCIRPFRTQLDDPLRFSCNTWLWDVGSAAPTAARAAATRVAKFTDRIFMSKEKADVRTKIERLGSE